MILKRWVCVSKKGWRYICTISCRRSLHLWVLSCFLPFPSQCHTELSSVQDCPKCFFVLFWKAKTSIVLKWLINNYTFTMISSNVHSCTSMLLESIPSLSYSSAPSSRESGPPLQSISASLFSPLKPCYFFPPISFSISQVEYSRSTIWTDQFSFSPSVVLWPFPELCLFW